VYRIAEDQGGFCFHRIVALPGDVIEIRDWTLFVNGNVIDVPYASLPKGREAFSKKMDAMTVPAGTVFVLGDNWDNSADSRFRGVIALQDVMGKIFAQKPSTFEGEFAPVR
jgi:signal peptidase I